MKRTTKSSEYQHQILEYWKPQISCITHIEDRFSVSLFQKIKAFFRHRYDRNFALGSPNERVKVTDQQKENSYVFGVHVLGQVPHFMTRWTVALQSPLSLGVSRQEYCSGLSFPSPWNFSHLGFKPQSPASSELAGEFFTSEQAGTPIWEKI